MPPDHPCTAACPQLPVLKHSIEVDQLSALLGSRVRMMVVQTGTDRIGHAAAAVVRTRPQKETISLQGALPLAVNNKEHGLMHQLSETSRTAPRDKRRTLCGWRAGSAAANARFCNTSVWPPLGAPITRLCSKCFPIAGATVQGGALSGDPITCVD